MDQGDGPRRALQGLLHDRALPIFASDARLMSAGAPRTHEGDGKEEPRRRIARIGSQALLQQIARFGDRSSGGRTGTVCGPQGRNSAQVQVVGIQSFRWFLQRRVDFGPPEVTDQHAGNPLRHFVLHLEQGAQLAIITLGPELNARRGIDQADIETNAVVGAAQASRHHVAGAEFAPDLDFIDIAVKGESRVARDQAQAPELGQADNQVLRHALAKYC